MEEQIINLEIISALQDETIAKLHEEIYQQQKDQAMLIRRIEKLEQKVANIDEQDPIGANERPPHY